jgi:hypothetical protein
MPKQMPFGLWPFVFIGGLHVASDTSNTQRLHKGAIYFNTIRYAKILPHYF